MARARWVGLGWLLTVGGCAQGSGSPAAGTDAPAPSLRANEPLRELTGAEAEALCEWENALLGRGNCLQNAIIAGGFRAQLSTDAATVANARHICESELELCTAPDRIAIGVLDCVRKVQTGFAQCTLDVSDAEACDHDLARDFATQPECEALTEETFQQVLYRMQPASCQDPACPS